MPEVAVPKTSQDLANGEKFSITTPRGHTIYGMRCDSGDQHNVNLVTGEIFLLRSAREVLVVSSFVDLIDQLYAAEGEQGGTVSHEHDFLGSEIPYLS